MKRKNNLRFCGEIAGSIVDVAICQSVQSVCRLPIRAAIFLCAAPRGDSFPESRCVLPEGKMPAVRWRPGGGFFTAPSTVAVFRFCLIHKNYGAGSRYDLPGERHTLNVQLLRQIVAGVEIGLETCLLSSDLAPYAAPAIFPGSILLSVGIDHTYGLLRRQLKFCPHKRSRLIYCYLCQR